MPDANELDRLMSLDPLELSAQAIDDIIAYQRRARASADSGVKPKKGVVVKIDLAALGIGAKKEIKKRKLT